MFAASNHEVVSLSLFPLSYAIDLPAFLLVILSIFAGALISLVVVSGRLSNMKLQYLSEKKRAHTLETELKGLRAKQTSMSTLPDITSNDTSR